MKMNSLIPPGKKTNFSHPGCYLNITSDCSHDISKEHYISKALLVQLGDLTITGMPWQKLGQGAALGVNALTSKILCERHNNALSPLDTAAARAFDVIGQAFQHALKWSLSRRTEHFLVDGYGLELWGVKTLMGIYHAKIAATGPDQAIFGKFELDTQIAADAFFGSGLPDPRGLYIHPDAEARTVEHIGVVPLLDDEFQRVVGLRASLRGLALDFIVEDRSFEVTLANQRAFYRPWVLDFNGPERRARVFMSWPSQAVDVRSVGMLLSRDLQRRRDLGHRRT